MCQRFYASKKDFIVYANGAIGYRSGSKFDCLGPYARVKNCPVEGTPLRLTCYATAYADTFFSVPACTRYRGKYIRGYFTNRDEGVVFCVLDAHKHLFPELA